MNEDKKTGKIWYVVLYASMIVMSLSGVCSKMAARQEFLSPPFFLYYGLMFVALGIYAIVWQQVIKHIPLITAGVNKSFGMVLSLTFGVLIFHETITVKQLLGLAIILAGIVMYMKAEGADE